MRRERFVFLGDKGREGFGVMGLKWVVGRIKKF